jgi:hypothetical protein
VAPSAAGAAAPSSVSAAPGDAAVPAEVFDASPVCAPGAYYSLASNGVIGRSNVTNRVPSGSFTEVGRLPINPDYVNGVPALGSQQGPANGLAVSSEGMFYGVQPRAYQTRDSRAVWYADILRFGSRTGTSAKVYSSFVIDRGAQDAVGWKQYRTIAGAVDSRSQEFVFGNVRDSGSGAWVLDVCLPLQGRRGSVPGRLRQGSQRRERRQR